MIERAAVVVLTLAIIGIVSSNGWIILMERETEYACGTNAAWMQPTK